MMEGRCEGGWVSGEESILGHAFLSSQCEGIALGFGNGYSRSSKEVPTWE